MGVGGALLRSSWSELRADYRQSLTAAKLPQTVRTYWNSIERFAKFCAQKEFDAVEAPTALIEMWIGDRLLSVGRSTIHTDLAGLKFFYAWAVEREIRKDDPAINIHIKRDKRRPTKPLDPEQVRQLFAGCRTERDRLILLVFASTASRISELAAMRAENIDWFDSSVRIIGKGDKERRIVLPVAIGQQLRLFLNGRRSGPLWISEYGRELAAHQIRKIIYKIADRAGIEGVHPHRFRAYFATEFLKETGDIEALQVIFGHESIATTARYTEYGREQRALDLMRRFNPGADLV